MKNITNNDAYLNPPVQEIKTSNSILFILKQVFGDLNYHTDTKEKLRGKD